MAKKNSVAAGGTKDRDVDLFCICRPKDKLKASWKVKTEYEIHANKDCPFRRPNNVQKW